MDVFQVLSNLGNTHKKKKKTWRTPRQDGFERELVKLVKGRVTSRSDTHLGIKYDFPQVVKDVGALQETSR